MTATEVHDAHAEHDEHVHPDSYYVKYAVGLALLTAAETSTYWIDFGPLFLPLLLIMMAIKFVTVVLIFMHLKTDGKWFNMAFWTGLGLAVACYCAALATFKFFV
jgi:cytochrome c oxidase subunit IV